MNRFYYGSRRDWEASMKRQRPIVGLALLNRVANSHVWN
jgi:hypothetical protein